MIQMLHIEIMMHYFACAGDLPPERMNSPAVVDAIGVLLEAGLLRPSTSDKRMYEGVDEPLRLYFDALRAVPLPQRMWIIRP